MADSFDRSHVCVSAVPIFLVLIFPTDIFHLNSRKPTFCDASGRFQRTQLRPSPNMRLEWPWTNMMARKCVLANNFDHELLRSAFISTFLSQPIIYPPSPVLQPIPSLLCFRVQCCLSLGICFHLMFNYNSRNYFKP